MYTETRFEMIINIEKSGQSVYRLEFPITVPLSNCLLMIKLNFYLIL